MRTVNLNAETQFALKYFNEQWPEPINDFYPRAKNIMVTPPPSVRPDDTLFKLGEYSFSISQVFVMDSNEIFDLRDELYDAKEAALNSGCITAGEYDKNMNPKNMCSPS